MCITDSSPNPSATARCVLVTECAKSGPGQGTLLRSITVASGAPGGVPAATCPASPLVKLVTPTPKSGWECRRAGTRWFGEQIAIQRMPQRGTGRVLCSREATLCIVRDSGPVRVQTRAEQSREGQRRKDKGLNNIVEGPGRGQDPERIMNRGEPSSGDDPHHPQPWSPEVRVGGKEDMAVASGSPQGSASAPAALSHLEKGLWGPAPLLVPGKCSAVGRTISDLGS